MSRVSANAFACGADQNRGNFMTDTPTTRVSQPPGGQSSFSLGWHDEHSHVRNRGISHNQVRESCDHDVGRTTPRMRRETDFRDGISERRSTTPRAHQAAHLRADRDEDAYSMTRREQFSYRSPCEDSDRSVVYGTRPRMSSNTFACGNQQNSGNVITDVPTTRVLAPPGGAASIKLAWEDDSCQRRNRDASNCGSSIPTATPGSRTASDRSDSDRDIRKSQRSDINLNGGVRSGTRPTTPVRDNLHRGGYIHDQTCTMGASTPRSTVSMHRRGENDATSARKMTQVEARTGLSRKSSWVDGSAAAFSKADDYFVRPPQEELEGSRPQKWKSSVRTNAPPGGVASFRPDWDFEAETRSEGKKLFLGAGGAGCNRDLHAIEELRFFQDPRKRVGKKAAEAHVLDRDVCDNHRFYIAPDGQQGRVPRKGRSTLPSGQGSSLSTCDLAGQPQDRKYPHNLRDGTWEKSSVASDMDSLPLGAEWCNFSEAGSASRSGR